MNVAIIAAGGRGTRMGGGAGSAPKQFLEIAGTPVVVHTLRRFEACSTVAEVIVVVPRSEVQAFLEFAEKFGLRKTARVVAGGETRTESVWRGLEAVRAAGVGVVAVHDAVRPLVTPEEIDATVRAAEATGAAILAARAVDTVKESDGAEPARVARTPDRSRLWHAQTPQCFRYDLLRRAYESARASGFEATDDSSLVERLGVPVRIVEGSARNIKITSPQDFALAEVMMKSSSQ
jgi:2-C-methyl-D-erythritol 4-phosphate cytidylyltransferase